MSMTLAGMDHNHELSVVKTSALSHDAAQNEVTSDFRHKSPLRPNKTAITKSSAERSNIGGKEIDYNALRP